MLNYIVNPVFVIKTFHGSKLYQGLYEHTGDEYDVVLMGSSHMNGGINPSVLWDRYGITSFNYATGGQPIDVTYYLLKEVLKEHENPIVVVDLYYLGLTKPYGEEGYIRYVLDNMKFSLNKMDAILHCTPRPHWLSYVFPIVKYHSRWKDLKQEDFNNDIEATYYEKGFAAEIASYGKENTADTEVYGTADIPPKSEEYLYKIINLSKEKGFRLAFINAPYDYNVTNNSNNWTLEAGKMFNKVAEIARENNIPFINYCNKFNELGFDFKTDMFNAGHLNISGSNKISSNLGKFLREYYNTADHRGDMRYAQWDMDYAAYSKAEAAALLKGQKEVNK